MPARPSLGAGWDRRSAGPAAAAARGGVWLRGNDVAVPARSSGRELRALVTAAPRLPRPPPCPRLPPPPPAPSPPPSAAPATAVSLGPWCRVRVGPAGPRRPRQVRAEERARAGEAPGCRRRTAGVRPARVSPRPRAGGAAPSLRRAAPEIAGQGAPAADAAAGGRRLPGPRAAAPAPAPQAPLLRAPPPERGDRCPGRGLAGRWRPRA